jgi:uncharacterized protein
VESAATPSKTPRFRPVTTFREETGYRLLPFRFLRWNGTEVLLTHDGGEFTFLSTESFRAFTRHRLHREEDAFADLKAKHFLAELGTDGAIERLATQYRTRKSFLAGFTKLHLFVVTLRCDHSCRYCQVSRVSADRTRYDMSEETAERAVDLLFRSPAPALKVEFQGGEPLLHFERIRFLVDRIEERNRQERRQIDYVITTNLVPLTEEVLHFCRDHSILLSISLDGPAFLHNANRPRPDRDSYEITIRHLQWAREVLGKDRISAVMTTTARSLAYPREIVDEYVRQGFSSIFLRPISPYGLAVRTGEAGGYAMSEFLDFYRTALDHIVEINRAGTPFVEVYTQILLARMLTPFPTGYVDLQSPAGAGLGVVAYNFDGSVHASDEARMLAEMGDSTFRLGSVHDSYEELFGGKVLRSLAESSVLESLPGCSDCAFLPYCGADPVFHHRTQGDRFGHRPTSSFCTKHMALFRGLFERLRGDDPFVRDLLIRWGTQP